MTQPEFKAFMDAQVAKWADVIKANHIPADQLNTAAGQVTR